MIKGTDKIVEQVLVAVFGKYYQESSNKQTIMDVAAMTEQWCQNAAVGRCRGYTDNLSYQTTYLRRHKQFDIIWDKHFETGNKPKGDSEKRDYGTAVFYITKNALAIVDSGGNKCIFEKAA